MKRIMLIDDDPNDIELALAAFAEFGFNDDVMVAHDGEEAMRLLQRRGEFTTVAGGNPALILLDLKMPRLTGCDVLRQLSEDEQLRQIPVIVVTTSKDENDISDSYRFGANAYVVKPVDFRRFVEMIRTVVSFWMDINEPPVSCIRPPTIIDQGKG